MKVRITDVTTGGYVEAIIKNPDKKTELPSIQQGWQYNFRKQSKVRGARTYVLTTDERPDVIEGCLIFRMIEEMEPYMAYIETAPHNRGKIKMYDEVASCLIAYACRLSTIEGRGDFKGWLAFHVYEEKEDNQIKLMQHYSKKYHAHRIENTNKMIINPMDGEKLINKHLK